MIAPNGTVNKGQWVKLSSFLNIFMQNETQQYICIRYDMKLVDDRTKALTSATRYGCMTAYSSFKAEHELYLAMNYPATGKYPNTTSLDIFDYPFKNVIEHGLVLVK